MFVGRHCVFTSLGVFFLVDDDPSSFVGDR